MPTRSTISFLFRFCANRFFVPIMSYFYAGYYLFPISACSFSDNLTVSTQPVPSFTQPIPFFASKRNNPLTLACIFLSTLYLFYPKPLSKKTQPSVSITLIPVGHNYYLFLYYSFIFSSGTFFLPEQIRIQSFSVSLCRYDVLLLLTGTK